MGLSPKGCGRVVDHLHSTTGTNRLYFFLSHQKATLKELMGAECKALELWTNSLVVVSLDSMNSTFRF